MAENRGRTKGKTPSNTNSVNIPSVYDNFHDSFLLDSRDVMQIMGYKIMSSVGVASSSGNIPSPVGRSDSSFSGYPKLLFLLGDFRKLKKLREKGLSYCDENLAKLEVENERGLKK